MTRVKIHKLSTYIAQEFQYCLHQPRPVLFDHVPKCAGSTVTKWLKHHYPNRLVFVTNGCNPFQSVQEFKLLDEPTRYRYKLIFGHWSFELAEHVHPETIKFTILRDPVERIVSHYYFVLSQKNHYLYEKVVAANISLEDYVTSGLSLELSNYYVHRFSGLSAQEMQNNPEGSIKKAIQTVLKTYDFVGFQSDLPSAIYKLKQRANLHLSFVNEVVNKTYGKVELCNISQHARKNIFEANELDIKFYQILQSLF